MSHDPDHSDNQADHEGTVSEAGSGALNPETALGGADSVPDTPDVNDPDHGGSTDLNEPGDESESR
ncbi:hypothetical protein [Knoellia sp. Soil729]|uniref:hypothetical protein n=1 Tax=Knoellia sp. Soil729 TaxID=1736394 RepID=UPI0006FE605F|nr:hypothetical protein [Knoellia sp. Soil729]KRE42421.1 hypothetical protein ASG74_08305 [Knoellia sp. Soil729]